MFDTLLQQLAATSWVEWLGMLTGIAGVVLSIKERISAWYFFIACYCCYIWISHSYDLYAFLFMNAAFVGIAVYGLLKWKSGSDAATNSLKIQGTPRSTWVWIVSFLIIGTAGIGSLLALRGEANMPYLDALATSCAFVAQWMLSRKYVQNWPFWLCSNSIYSFIFIKSAAWPSVLLFAILICLGIAGWRDWSAKLKSVV